jgi:uncharacterized glyoxalase superfamily protein PhnB
LKYRADWKRRQIEEGDDSCCHLLLFSQGIKGVRLHPAPRGGTSIHLTDVNENMKPGSMNLILSTPDIEAAYQELKEKGVRFTDAIIRAGWGASFGFTDPDGDQWRVVESKK